MEEIEKKKEKIFVLSGSKGSQSMDEEYLPPPPCGRIGYRVYASATCPCGK